MQPNQWRVEEKLVHQRVPLFPDSTLFVRLVEVYHVAGRREVFRIFRIFKFAGINASMPVSKFELILAFQLRV